MRSEGWPWRGGEGSWWLWWGGGWWRGEGALCLGVAEFRFLGEAPLLAAVNSSKDRKNSSFIFPLVGGFVLFKKYIISMYIYSKALFLRNESFNLLFYVKLHFEYVTCNI